MLLDKLYSSVDLDPVLVSEEDRDKMYKLLEETALTKETAVVLMFEAQDSCLVQVELDSESDNPKTILIKPASGSMKVDIWKLTSNISLIIEFLVDSPGQLQFV